MAITITDLAVTEGYADDNMLTETQLNAAVGDDSSGSIEYYINNSVITNIIQIAKDAWGTSSAYTLDGDGTANMTATLFNKQYATDYYNGGNITIGTSADSAWAAVDAVNASLSFKPEMIGQYRVTCYFTHRATSTATTEFEIDTGFRLTDGTDASYAVNSGGYMPATAAASGEFFHPCFITFVFDWSTTTTKTITLQKYNRTCTAVSANVVSAAAATGEFYIVCEKI